MGNEAIKEWKAGEPLWQRRLNQLVRASRRNIVGDSVINVTSTESSVLITHQPHDWDWFPAKIQAGSGAFADQRYYVQRQQMTNTDAGASDLLTWSDYWAVPSDFKVVAQNLAEVNSHILGSDRVVNVFRRMDQAGPPALWRYYISEPPILCFNSDFDSHSDLSDLSAIYRDITADDPHKPIAASDYSDDITTVFFRGHNYVDPNGHVNPWNAVRLPLCYHSDHYKSDQIADSHLSDITGQWADGSDVAYICRGEFFKDPDSDLNPILLMRLGSSASPAWLMSDVTLSNSDNLTASTTTWDINNQGANTGYKEARLTRWAYDQATHNIYGFYRIRTVNSFGRIVAETAETRYTIHAAGPCT